MSLYQCDRCGCLENTSCSGGYHLGHHLSHGEQDGKHLEAIASYKEILGLRPGEPFGSYCSACDPGWWADSNNYGVGPRPEGYTDRLNHHTGQWHGKFDRLYLPKGLFHTNDDGNLSHILTLETDIDKYALPSEDRPGYHTHHPDYRLPRPSEKARCASYLKAMEIITEHGHDMRAMQAALERYHAQPEAPMPLCPTCSGPWTYKVEKAAGVGPGAADGVVLGDRHTWTCRRCQSEGENGVYTVTKIGEGGIVMTKTRQETARQPGKVARMAATMAAIASAGPVGRLSRPAPEPVPPTPEELERDKALQATRMAKAEEKRRMRAEKRKPCPSKT